MSVRITARPIKGIRRVGTFHPAEAVVYPDGYFDEGELTILMSDPDLIVDRVDGEDARLVPAERRLQLMQGDGGNGSTDGAKQKAAAELQHEHPLEQATDATEREISEHAHPDDGHAPSSKSAEQQAAEGTGTDDTTDETTVDETLADPKVVDGELPYFSIADLAGGIAGLDEVIVQAMADRDQRSSAKPIYAKRLRELRGVSEAE